FPTNSFTPGASGKGIGTLAPPHECRGQRIQFVSGCPPLANNQRGVLVREKRRPERGVTLYRLTGAVRVIGRRGHYLDKPRLTQNGALVAPELWIATMRAHHPERELPDQLESGIDWRKEITSRVTVANGDHAARPQDAPHLLQSGFRAR